MKKGATYRTIEDFLVAHPLTVDVEIDDEWSGSYPVKGVEFNATVVFIELADYFRLSFSLQSNELLIYVNHFHSWIKRATDASGCRPLFRFFDHALMLVFSEKTGSTDSFSDALSVARRLGEHDVHRFCPRVGIASGPVTAGYTVMADGRSATVLGEPVALAAAFAAAAIQDDVAMRITVASHEWGTRTIADQFPPVEYDDPEQGRVKQPQTWELGKVREIDCAAGGKRTVRDIASFIRWSPEHSADKQARNWFAEIQRRGLYRKVSG